MLVISEDYINSDHIKFLYQKAIYFGLDEVEEKKILEVINILKSNFETLEYNKKIYKLYPTSILYDKKISELFQEFEKKYERIEILESK